MDEEMKRYKVPFAYERYGYIYVKASSETEAKEKAEEKLLTMGDQEMYELSDYLPDSEEIDEEGEIFEVDDDGNVINAPK